MWKHIIVANVLGKFTNAIVLIKTGTIMCDCVKKIGYTDDLLAAV